MYRATLMISPMNEVLKFWSSFIRWSHRTSWSQSHNRDKNIKKYIQGAAKSIPVRFVAIFSATFSAIAWNFK